MGPLLDAHYELRSLAPWSSLKQELQSLRVPQSAPVWDLLACISASVPGGNSRSQNKSALNNIKAPHVEDLKLVWTRDDDTAVLPCCRIKNTDSPGSGSPSVRQHFVFLVFPVP